MKKKQLLQIAEKMRKYIGSTPCTCVESQAYKDYQDLINTGKDNFERLMLSLAHEGPSVEDSIDEECMRCQLIMEFDTTTGLADEDLFKYADQPPVSEEESLARSEQFLRELIKYRNRKDGGQ